MFCEGQHERRKVLRAHRQGKIDSIKVVQGLEASRLKVIDRDELCMVCSFSQISSENTYRRLCLLSCTHLVDAPANSMYRSKLSYKVSHPHIIRRR